VLGKEKDCAGMEELTIDREFDELCPALSDDEERLLEQSLLADGCLHSIITWANHDDTVLDGHNRYRLCKKHGIKFQTKRLKIDSRDDAREWIIRQQIGRRNLDASQRAMLAAKLVNSQAGGDHRANLHGEITAEKAAEEFNVSDRSVKAARKVIEHGSKPLQRAVESGEVAVSAAAVVSELPKSEQSKLVDKGPEAVAEKAKKLKAADKPKQHKDSFDTETLDKELAKEKKPGSVKKTFKDETLDELLGKVMRAIDDRWNRTWRTQQLQVSGGCLNKVEGRLSGCVECHLEESGRGRSHD
jgi:hypothetical protein